MSLGNDIKNDASLPDGKYEKSNNHKLPDIATINGINDGDNGRYITTGLLFNSLVCLHVLIFNFVK